eukprot:3495837-Rhodomonas_salina.3
MAHRKASHLHVGAAAGEVPLIARERSAHTLLESRGSAARLGYAWFTCSPLSTHVFPVAWAHNNFLAV